jgi:hypothetical protein
MAGPARVDIEPGAFPLAATITATLHDVNGVQPNNVLRDDDNSHIDVRIEERGIGFDIARFNWQLLLRVEGNPSTAGPSQDFFFGPVTVNHNGVPGGAPYSHSAQIQVPAGSLPVPNGQSQSYEFTVELVALDPGTNLPFGIGGFLDLGEVMVIKTP